MSNGIMNGGLNRKLLFVLGPVTGVIMFAGVVLHRDVPDQPRVQGALPGSCRGRRSDAARGGTRSRESRGGSAPIAPSRTSRPSTGQFPVVGSRVAIWAVAQLHLLFAAFVLAVPIFAVLIEAIGYKTGDLRYDRLAYEFTKLLSVSFSLTATFGAALTFMLIALYPKFTNYLMNVFSPTFLPYVLLFFLEAFFLYTYYYGWGKFHPLVHLGLGIGLNVVGTGIMLIANAWLTFMMSPAGISDTGAVISVSDAITNYTWMPINVHRVIANVAFGGSVAAAYAAFKFLNAETVLMDQRVVAGIGNVYRAEVLFRHRLDPYLPGRDLDASDLGGGVGRRGDADAGRSALGAHRHDGPPSTGTARSAAWLGRTPTTCTAAPGFRAASTAPRSRCRCWPPASSTGARRAKRRDHRPRLRPPRLLQRRRRRHCDLVAHPPRRRRRLQQPGPRAGVRAENGGRLLAFAISFGVIAKFWVVHHQMFERINGYTMTVVWTNMLWLATIVFLPLPTELLGSELSSDALVRAVYIGSVFAVSASLSLVNIVLARSPELHRDPQNPPEWYGGISVAALFVVIFVVAVFVPAIGMFAMFLLFLSGPVEALISRAAGRPRP